MSRKAMIYLGREKENRLPEVGELAHVLVDDYAEQVLVEATEEQLARLRQQGFSVAELPTEQRVQINEYEFGRDELTEGDEEKWANMMGFHHIPLAPLVLAPEEAREPRLYLVFLVGPTLKGWKDDIEAQGAVIRDAAGSSGFVVAMDDDALGRVEQLPFVEAVRVYHTGLKISPALAEAEAETYAAVEPQPTAQDVEIEVYEPGDRERVANRVRELEGNLIDQMETTIIATLPDPTAVHQLAEDTAVRVIHSYADDEYFNDVAAKIMNVQAVRSNNDLDGADQVVAVCDSGLDIGQNGPNLLADFRDRVAAIHAWGRPHDASDLHGHGTHVAGSIVGTGVNTRGAVTGLAPEARLVFQSTADDKGKPRTPPDLTPLLRQALTEGATIHSNSWGKKSSKLWGRYNAQSRQIDAFIWKHRKFLVVFAAGNEGRGGGRVTPPGTAKNCLTVGATESQRPLPRRVRFPPSDRHPSGITVQLFDQADDPKQVADFSNRGPTVDRRVKPDVVAPGCWILSTRSSVCVADYGPDGLPRTDFKEGVDMTHDKAVGRGLPGKPVRGTGDRNTPPLPAGVDPGSAEHYMYLSGTSMATPLVSGTVALCRQYLVQNLNHSNPSAALLKAILVNGAVNVGGGSPDMDQGWGRVDLERALFPPPGRPIAFSDDPSLALSTGKGHTFVVRPADLVHPLRITLAYSDAPGPRLVNRLCLVVRDPRGRLLAYPRAEAPTFPPLSAQVHDNVQRVVVSTPMDGDYQVIVYGCEVQVGVAAFPNDDGQDFALVVANAAGPLEALPQ